MKKNHKDKFKTPEGYFDSFNEKLMERIVEETSGIPKSDGFAVPEGYFDTLYPKVSNRIDSAPKVIALHPYKKYFYVAASIAAGVILYFGVKDTQESQVQFDDLANSEISSYFEDTDIGLSSYEIAQVVEFDTEELDALENASLEDELILEYIEDTTDSYDELNLDYEFEE